MIGRTLAIAAKELLQLRRDLRTTVALLGMPVVLLFVFGFALSFDVRHVRLAVVDEDGSRAGRDLVAALLASGDFDLVSHRRDSAGLDRLFDSGKAQAAIVIPGGYGRDLAAGRSTTVQFVLDGSDAQMANATLGHVRQIVASVSPMVRPRGGAGPVAPLPLVWYNPDLASSRFLVPGLVAFILTITSVIATALAVVREKERGTMESLRATPLVAVELILGKTLPYLFIASLSATLSLIVANLLFDVPMRGSIVGLAVVTVVFLAGGLGWGILLSTLADTQQVAFQLGLVTSMLPTLLLSGFMFPISSMPLPLRVVTHIIPARFYLAALRAIVLKGAGLADWWSDLVGLAIFAVVVLTLGTVRLVRSL
jgi:ABC-2 type transport system permease protein